MYSVLYMSNAGHLDKIMFYGAYLNPRYQLGLYPAAAAVDIIRDTMFTLDPVQPEAPRYEGKLAPS